MNDSELNGMAKSMLLKISLGYMAHKVGLTKKDFDRIDEITTVAITEVLEEMNATDEQIEKCLMFSQRDVDLIQRVKRRLSLG